MKNAKQIIIVSVSVVLLGSLIFLTYMLSSGGTPIGLFNLRASNPQDEVDTFLSENNIPTAEPTEDPGLLAFNSTSPSPTPPSEDAVTPSVSTSPAPSTSVTPSISISPTGTTTKGGVTITETPTPTPTDTPTPTPTETPTPEVVSELPVAGIGTQLWGVVAGAGALILLAFVL